MIVEQLPTSLQPVSIQLQKVVEESVIGCQLFAHCCVLVANQSATNGQLNAKTHQ